jgi:hypothetical protein
LVHLGYSWYKRFGAGKVCTVTSQEDSSRTTCAFNEGIKNEERKEEVNYLTGGFVDITHYLTRTGGLRSTLVGRSGVVLVGLPLMYAYGAN